MRDKFDRLSPREQRILMIAAPVVLILALWLLLFRPLLETQSQLSQRILHQQADIQWMKTAAAQIQRSPSASPLPTTGATRQQVTRILGQFGIAVSRIEQNSDQGINVWVEKTVFNVLMRALQQAVSAGLHVEKAQINQTDTSGVVSARLTFTAVGTAS